MKGYDIKRTKKVLIIGTGNSKLPQEMYDDGYFEITCNDLSENCISQMKILNQDERPGIQWDVMDAC